MTPKTLNEHDPLMDVPTHKPEPEPETQAEKDDKESKEWEQVRDRPKGIERNTRTGKLRNNAVTYVG